MLFERDRHEAVAGGHWNDERARAAVRDIVRDTQDRRMAAGHWMVHPRDAEGQAPAQGYQSLYLGTAGVLWALAYLQQAGAADLDFDPRPAAEAADAAYLRAPDTEEVIPSYFLGETGVLLVRWKLGAGQDVAGRLYAAIESNITNPTNEALWAAPGTMLAAEAVWRATGDARWRDLLARNVEQVWNTWHFDDDASCWLWTQQMYGKVTQYLGAGHGFAGNAYALLRASDLLDEGRIKALYERCVATLGRTARFEGDRVNWAATPTDPRPGGPRMLMQWCHGAPGIVTSLAAFPAGVSSEMDDMLLAAGRGIWAAGPLAKGHGLCHGTAGNGYAFLKLFQRTGDDQWRDRARAFAMHALGQRDRMRQEFGQGRYSLWTGDLGLAVYLWHCITGEDAMPALDFI